MRLPVAFSRRRFVATLLGALAARPVASDAGRVEPEGGRNALDALRRRFLDPPDAAKPMTRWWWFGGAVTPEEITRELTFMKEAGLRGAEIQPVYPVAVDDAARGIRHHAYHSGEFLAALRHAAREARRLGLQLDLTLGSGWPYGGPFIPANRAAQRLRIVSQDVVGPRELAWDVTAHLAGDDRPVAVVAAPVLPGGEPDLARSRTLPGQPAAEASDGRRSSIVRFTAPPGPWRVMLFLASLTGQQVKRPTLGMEGYVLDHFSREAMDLFLRAAGDRVLDTVGNEGGPPFHSVFCDSLEVYGADWTGRLLAEFKARRGYDLAPHLPALFFDCGPTTPHVRYDYRLTLSELGLERFFRPLAEWAERRGVQARIQAHGAPGDVLQAYGTAHIPEGETIFLGDRYQVNLRHRRLASSASHLYGKPLTSSETYTWLRTPLYTTTLEMMKPATDAVLLDGVNHIVNHGYSYSPPQAGEPGWAFYASTEVNHTNTWWRHYPHLARYIQRACALLQEGTSVNPVGVYLPLADILARSGAGGLHVDVETEASIDARLVSGLRRSGYDFDVVHDHALEALARVEGGRLRIGTAEYAVILVPGARLMPPPSIARLLAFAREGGHVIFVERVPEGTPGLGGQEERERAFGEAMRGLFPSGTPAHGAAVAVGRGTAGLVADAASALARLRTVLHPDLRIVTAGDGGPAAVEAAVQNVGFSHRRSGAADWYFVANLSPEARDLRIQFDVGHRRPERWGPETGTVQAALVYAFAAASGRKVTEVRLHLDPFESCFVVFGASSEPPAVVRTDWPGPLEIRTQSRRVEIDGRVPANGAYLLTLASGRTQRVAVSDVPPAVDVPGPWRLSLGARPPARLDRLHSWNDLPEGRRFSGWGVYQTEFEMPALPAEVDWWLDLGAVHETAEAVLNGTPLGVAWKAPRRLACGGALRSGRNHLEVRVANLWIHDMVARDPPREWAVLEETWGIRWGRYGEVKPEALPPSGLLGPVRLAPYRRVTVRIER